MKHALRLLARPALVLVLVALPLVSGPDVADASEPRRLAVPKDRIALDDGDSFLIRWPEGPQVVRILGIDTPEVRHVDHDIPFAQPFGEKAAGFLEGCLAVADEVEILQSGETDPYGRTLAYLILDGKNYSVLVLRARLATENVSHFGDNGLPEPAAACLAAAEAAGPVPFESPHVFRRRMRKVSTWMRKKGLLPPQADDPPEPPTRTE